MNTGSWTIDPSVVAPNSDLATALKRNKKLLLLFFAFTAFHGIIRKWLIPNNAGVSNLLVLVQLFLPIILSFGVKKDDTTPTGLRMVLVFYAVALLGFALNPMNESIMHGIFGFITHLSFWLLMFTYINHRDSFPIENILFFIAISCAVEVALASIQFVLPSDHFLNRYDRQGDGAATMGAYTRVTGTFSYVTGFGCFIFLVGCCVWAMMVEGRKNVIFTAALLGMGFYGAFMSGARAVVATYVLMVIFGIIAASTRQKMTMIATTLVVLGLVLVYATDKQLKPFINAYDAFASRTKELNQTGETAYRLAGPLDETFNFRGNYPILGVGLGATYQGAIAMFGKSRYVKEYGFYEEDPERIILEGGFVLFLIRLFMFFLLARNLLIPLPQLLLLFFFMIFFLPLVFNIYQTCFAFLGLALVDKMYYLKKKEKDVQTA